MATILDKDFVYVPSGKTDIRETFKRVLAQREVASVVRSTVGSEPTVPRSKGLLGKRRATQGQ